MPTDYPPLPTPWWARDMHGETEAYTADQMRDYLTAERARIEREVMPLVGLYAANKRANADEPVLHDSWHAILRAIRGEKEPT